MKKIIVASIAILAVTGTLMADINPATCAGCHGSHFEKKALGVSAVVADMTHKEIEKALLGFKDGTYKGPVPAMAGVMKGQVARYSDEDLKELAQKIGK